MAPDQERPTRFIRSPGFGIILARSGSETMQVMTISFFRFSTLWGRLWAFFMMQFARRPLREIDGIGFHRIMGSGAGEGFDLAPNLSVYAILATWPSLEHAREKVKSAGLFGRYRARATEDWTVFVTPTRARGSWSGANPFQPNEIEGPPTGLEGWVGVLTRATVRRRRLLAFWRSVPAVSSVTSGRPGLHFKLGMGEFPIVQLMTFSLWNELKAAKAFAYDPGPHREAMQLARKQAWFDEELYARFRVLESSGVWMGRDPISDSVAEVSRP